MKSIIFSIFIMSLIAPLAHSNEGALDVELVHEAGFSVSPSLIDGPDYYSKGSQLGKEVVFQEAYELLRSRYGNDYLPDKLPSELLPIRTEIYKYMKAHTPGKIGGGATDEYLRIIKKSGKVVDAVYKSGANGIDNGEAFDYSIDGLPDKITRLSYCFGISPRVLTAKISVESKFVGSAVSKSGAVGFSQLTSTGIVEVLEQLGFGSSGTKKVKSIVNHKPKGKEIYREYIDCYLKEGERLVTPWTDELMYSNGSTHDYLVNPDYWTSIKRSSRGRVLKTPYSSRMDRWLTGNLKGSSHDNGLLYGAILFKHFLGHNGIELGVTEYNGDDAEQTCGGARRLVKECYARKLLREARKMDLSSIDI